MENDNRTNYHHDVQEAIHYGHAGDEDDGDTKKNWEGALTTQV